MFEHAAVGIAISELDGRLAETNAKFCEILGYRGARARAARRPTTSPIPTTSRATRAYVARLVAGEIPDYSYEKRYVRKDGRVVWTLTSVGLLRDPQGRPRQFVGVIEDITALKKAQLESERAARAEAERMSEMKDEFLATLSHELRTPLSAILGWAQVLAPAPDGARGAASARCEVIERNARAQTQLIEDLLDM